MYVVSKYMLDMLWRKLDYIYINSFVDQWLIDYYRNYLSVPIWKK